VGLVNTPNFRDLTSLNSEDNKTGEEMSIDKDILKALALEDDSNKDAVLQTIHDLKNKSNNTDSEKLLAQITRLNMEIANRNADRFNDKKNQAIEDALKQGKILPATKEIYETTLNSEDALNLFVKAMDSVSGITNSTIKNPNEAKEKQDTSLNFEEKEHCKRYGLNEEEFKKVKVELYGNN
jgi:phage I-like protein